MKRLLILLLLVAAPVALPQSGPNSSFYAGVEQCTDIAVVYTQIATVANNTKDSDKPIFIAYVEQLANRNQSARAKAIIEHMGSMAWAARGDSVTGDAMSLYEQCFDNLGTKV